MTLTEGAAMTTTPNPTDDTGDTTTTSTPPQQGRWTALTYPSANDHGEHGVDIVYASTGEDGSLSDAWTWVPVSGHTTWTPEDADALLSAHGWTRVQDWQESTDLGAGMPGWSAPVQPTQGQASS